MISVQLCVLYGENVMTESGMKHCLMFKNVCTNFHNEVANQALWGMSWLKKSMPKSEKISV